MYSSVVHINRMFDCVLMALIKACVDNSLKKLELIIFFLFQDLLHVVTGEAAEASVEAVVVGEVAVVAEVLEEVAVEAAVAQGAAVEVDAELPEVVEDQGEGAGADVGEDPR